MLKQEAASQLALRLRQGAERADRLDVPVPGRFVTGEERALAVHMARECRVAVSFDGGWTDAERVQVCFHPAWAEAEFTGVWVEVRWAAKFARADHRDLLGSLMALGMDRAFFGDLIALEDRAYLYALPEMASRLPMEWDKAGNVPLKVTLLDEPPVFEMPKGDELRDTVASLRLDCVLSSGMKTSRAKAAELIRAGHVAVDHAAEERTDRVLAAGQLLSIRGFGRIRLVKVGEKTRKDRLPVTLEIFRRS
ncbi:MAG: RNA-binding protein [Clostridia bacterium]|nr:RNA-binding protein [Clostridia bacterium]